MGKIILGSSSPRRADILTKMKIDFEVIPSSYEEKHDKTVFSYNYVERLAYNKALAVAKDIRKQGRDETVLGADTIVVIDNKILGKPANFDEAFDMLKMLSGRIHFVVTALALVNSKRLTHLVKSDTTYVTFEYLTDEQITNYINEFKPYDKAGGYGIQELPIGFIHKIKGDVDNVIGLPSRMLREMFVEEENKRNSSRWW